MRRMPDAASMARYRLELHGYTRCFSVSLLYPSSRISSYHEISNEQLHAEALSPVLVRPCMSIGRSCTEGTYIFSEVISFAEINGVFIVSTKAHSQIVEAWKVCVRYYYFPLFFSTVAEKGECSKTDMHSPRPCCKLFRYQTKKYNCPYVLNDSITSILPNLLFIMHYHSYVLGRENEMVASV